MLGRTDPTCRLCGRRLAEDTPRAIGHVIRTVHTLTPGNRRSVAAWWDGKPGDRGEEAPDMSDTRILKRYGNDVLLLPDGLLRRKAAHTTWIPFDRMGSIGWSHRIG